MAVTDPRHETPLLRLPPIRDYGTPDWYARLPAWAGAAGVPALLVLFAGFIRVHQLDAQWWSEEANTVGIATHSLTAIPGILWHGSGAPLYFMLLHVWMQLFGDSEIAVHALSVLFGVAVVPVGIWLGWSLYGRRVGFMLGTLLTFNAWLIRYSEEARPYELMALIGLVATGAFLHAFVHRRRGWLPALAVSLALLVYTDAWGFFFWGAAVLAGAIVWWRSDDRSGIARDLTIVLGAGFVLYLPWLVTLIHQAISSTGGWHYAPLIRTNPPRDITGSDRVDTLLLLALLAGCMPLLAGRRRRSPEATAVWVLATLAVGTSLLAYFATLLVPAMTARYLGPVVGPLLVLVAIGCARSGVLGLAVLIVTSFFNANPASFIPQDKSNMKDVAAELQPHLRAGDLVLVTQPDQAPLAWYYLPAGLRYATALGPDPHPTWMNWDNAQTRLQDAAPAAVVHRLVASLAPGQRLAVIRPLTEGEHDWTEAWSELVRQRSARLSGVLASDPQLRVLAGFHAPHFYRSACCIASSALIYVKR